MRKFCSGLRAQLVSRLSKLLKAEEEKEGKSDDVMELEDDEQEKESEKKESEKREPDKKDEDIKDKVEILEEKEEKKEEKKEKTEKEIEEEKRRVSNWQKINTWIKKNTERCKEKRLPVYVCKKYIYNFRLVRNF